MNGLTVTERLAGTMELFRKMLKNFAAGFRVSCPGIIQSFDADKQTVTVKLALRERVITDGVIDYVDVPFLVDIPVFMPRAGGYVLTMPVTAGDECLVIFGDGCIDSWYQSGGIQNPMSSRRHDLSDGFAIIGPWSQPRVVSDYKTDAAQLRNEAGSSYVEIKGDTITIRAADQINFETPLMNWLIDSLTSVGFVGSGHVGNMTLNCNTIDIEASTHATINSNGDPVVIDGRTFMTHQHINGGGTGNSGGVA